MTSFGSHGNHARIYVEMDLMKPLLLKFKLRMGFSHVVNEGLHLMCFNNG